MTAGEEMSKAERIELAKVVRMRARVARSEVDARRAELLADAEAALAAEYDAADPRWAEVTAAAQAAVAEADAQVERLCTELGVRPEFRPRLALAWHARGVNGIEKRRTELRKVAATAADAAAKRARATIDAEEARLCTELAARALTTGEARSWLEALPAAVELMPPLTLAELEAQVAP